MPDLPPERAAVPDGFAVKADGAAGRTRRQLRHLELVAPSRGLRVRVDADDPWRANLAATLAGVRPGSVACGATAARLWGLPLPAWIGLDDRRAIQVAAPPDGAHADRPQVVGRRLDLPPEHVTTCDGLAVTTPARTWLDCAAELPLDHLVAMGDALLRRNLADEPELAAITHWGFRRRGVAVARRAVPLLDRRAESPGESRLRTMLVEGRVPRPLCNYDVVDRGGWLARADLAWPAQRVIVEYDGIAHLAEKQRRHDATRRNLLQDAGWLVIVVTADQLARPWDLVAMVRAALRRGDAVRSSTPAR